MVWPQESNPRPPALQSSVLLTELILPWLNELKSDYLQTFHVLKTGPFLPSVATDDENVSMPKINIAIKNKTVKLFLQFNWCEDTISAKGRTFFSGWRSILVILVIPVYSCAFHNRRKQNPSKSLKIYHENTKRVDCREYNQKRAARLMTTEGHTYTVDLCSTQRTPRSVLAPKAWLNQGLPGCKPGWTNQTFLVFKPSLPDFTNCAKSLVNQGIPGKRGKPGYP